MGCPSPSLFSNQRSFHKTSARARRLIFFSFVRLFGGDASPPPRKTTKENARPKLCVFTTKTNRPNDQTKPASLHCARANHTHENKTAKRRRPPPTTPSFLSFFSFSTLFRKTSTNKRTNRAMADQQAKSCSGGGETGADVGDRKRAKTEAESAREGPAAASEATGAALQHQQQQQQQLERSTEILFLVLECQRHAAREARAAKRPSGARCNRGSWRLAESCCRSAGCGGSSCAIPTGRDATTRSACRPR